MRRADRLLQIIQILRRRRGPSSGQAIAEELEVSVRTLYRDIATLQASGVPVVGEAGVGYVLDNGYDLPPLMFTEQELEIVMLGLRMAANHGDTVIQRTARDAVAKISAVLPGALKSRFLEAPLIAPGPAAATTDGPALLSLRDALRLERKVEILYQVPERPPERRVIWPIAVAFFDRSRVVAAWCELRRDYRYFRSDRILEMNILPATLPRPRRQLYTEWRRSEGLEAQVTNL